jgi:DNA-binding IclR family transcriptional regulator
MSAAGESDDFRRAAYSAPALEKGLDIIELLAAAQEPLSTRQIAEQLGRSKNEIFRMVFVLVERGYLSRDAATDLLTLSNRLFELGMRTPRSRELLEVAVPAMERLSGRVGSSSHLVVVNKGETVVIATATGNADINFTLRLGYRRPALNATSGQTIIAFQDPAMRARIIEEAMDGTASDRQIIIERLDGIVADGYLVAPSRDIVGVTDICAPILDRNGRAVASVVIPCLQRHGAPSRHAAIRDALLETCAEISDSLR